MKNSIRLRDSKIREMRKEGYTLQVIGDTFGISRQRVQQVLDKEYNTKRRALYTGRKISLDKKRRRV